MAFQYTIRPISDRTPFGGKHRPNPFRSTWEDTLKVLSDELTVLKATNVVFEVDVDDASQVRNDGMLRAHAKVNSGAVRIAFDSVHGPLTYATDRYVGSYYSDPPDWQINVRAIALGLGALRKIERYGIVKRDEQYLGFKQLPSGRAMPASHMTRDAALGALSQLLEAELLPDQIAAAIRRCGWQPIRQKLIRVAHPDRRDGDHAVWTLYQEACAVLGVSS